jgi:ATP-dependent RNA helicase RhlE
MKLDKSGEAQRGQDRGDQRIAAVHSGQKKPFAPRSSSADKTRSPSPSDGHQSAGGQADLKTYRGRSSRANGGKPKAFEDPLFTQPYTPSTTNSLAPSTTQSTDNRLHYRHGRQSKPLAALFQPRPPIKTEQDES